jgi:hypothetical protein
MGWRAGNGPLSGHEGYTWGAGGTVEAVKPQGCRYVCEFHRDLRAAVATGSQSAMRNYEVFISRFGRVEDFDEKEDNYRKWTFWTYAQRAVSIMGKWACQLDGSYEGNERSFGQNLTKNSNER